MLEGRRRWCVVQGDSRIFLRGLRGGQVAHVITDPPYDEDTHTRARSTKGGGSDIPIDFPPLDDPRVALEWLRVARRWVLAFCALEMLGDYKRAVGRARWARAGVWARPDGTPQLSGDRPAQGAEGIAVMHAAGEKLRWNGGGSRGLWTHGVERVERHHPTPKPIELMLELVRLFTDKGDVVLDPYCGSGTTGVACLRLGRRFIGFELDPKHAATARARLEAEEQHRDLSAARTPQLGLFGGRP